MIRIENERQSVSSICYHPAKYNFMTKTLPFLATLLISLLSLSLGAEPEKPNVIFVFADDVGWGDLGCYGNDRTQTPSLDKLAQEGTLFTQFYVPGSVCSPSRAGIMTERFPSRDRVFSHFARPEHNRERNMPEELDPNIYTLTDMLRSGGYVTAHFGKWHLGLRNTSPHSEYGIDVYRTNKHSNIKGGNTMDISSPEARPTSSKRIIDETLDFIREHQKQETGKPFYANVWLFDMHATLNPSHEQMEPFRTLGPNQPGVNFHGIEEVYFAALLEMDKQIGRLINELDAMDMRKNTLIIFSSDNGPEDPQLGEAGHSGAGNTGPFRGRKRSLYEGGIRMPFILRWPGHVPEGQVNRETVINGVDFMPTLATLTKTEAPEAFEKDGEDLSSAWLGADTRRSKPMFWEYRFGGFGHPMHQSPMIAVREGDYKLLFNPDLSRIELYHIPKDPSEMNNLAGDNPVMTEELLKTAMDWFLSLPEGCAPFDRAGDNRWNWPQ